MTTYKTYAVCRMDKENMQLLRWMFVPTELGRQITNNDVLRVLETEVRYFKPGQYRAIPEEAWINFNVQAAVELA